MKPHITSPVDPIFPMEIHFEKNDPERDEMERHLHADAMREYCTKAARSSARRSAARLVAWAALVPFVGVWVFAFLNKPMAMFLCGVAIASILLISQRIGRVRGWGVSVNIGRRRNETIDARVSQ